MEKPADGSRSILLAGLTLEVLSGGALPACLPRVKGTVQSRLSLVYQARARDDAAIDLARFNAAPWGTSTDTGADLLRRMRSTLTSVNETYAPARQDAAVPA